MSSLRQNLLLGRCLHDRLDLGFADLSALDSGSPSYSPENIETFDAPLYGGRKWDAVNDLCESIDLGDVRDDLRILQAQATLKSTSQVGK